MRKSVLIVLVVVAFQALLVPLFAGPASHLAPRDLPIAVAAPPPVIQRLEARHPGAFEVTVVADAAAVDAAIRDRSAYGGIVVTPAGAEMHVASAASPAVSALLGQAGAQMGARVVDVVPAQSVDPRGAMPGAGSSAVPGAGSGAVPGAGAGFGAAFLPLAITALAAGALVFLLVPSRGGRVLALLTYAVAGGLGGAVVLHGWLDIVPGSFWGVAGVLGLFGLGIAAAMSGLGALLGKPGLGLGALVMFLIGNALSAVAAAPELLPQPWGEVGQWLPIGAGATLLRSVAYFDGSGGLAAGLVLSAYALGGLALVMIGRRGLGEPEVPQVADPLREPSTVS